MSEAIEIHRQQGLDILENYAMSTGDKDEENTTILADLLANLLADLMHAADGLEVNFTEALNLAMDHYETEKEEAKALAKQGA